MQIMHGNNFGVVFRNSEFKTNLVVAFHRLPYSFSSSFTFLSLIACKVTALRNKNKVLALEFFDV